MNSSTCAYTSSKIQLKAKGCSVFIPQKSCSSHPLIASTVLFVNGIHYLVKPNSACGDTLIQ